MNLGANRQPLHQGQSSGDKIGQAVLRGVTQIDQERIKNPLKKLDAYLQDLRCRSQGSRDRTEHLFLLNLSLMETKLRK